MKHDSYNIEYLYFYKHCLWTILMDLNYVPQGHYHLILGIYIPNVFEKTQIHCNSHVTLQSIFFFF